MNRSSVRIYNRVQERRHVDNTTECRGKQLNCASLRIGLACTVGNRFIYVRIYKWPFLRFTDDRKRCYNWKTDLILRWRYNTKLVLSATTRYWDP